MEKKNKKIKKTSKKRVVKLGKAKKAPLIFKKEKKSGGSNFKIAFYIVFIIIVVLVLYFINFKKPKQHVQTDENNVISDMLTNVDLTNYDLNADNSNLIFLPSTFKAYKQSNIDSSGPASIMSILSYYGKDGVFTEEIVENMKSEHEPYHKGTCINQIKEILTTLNLKYWTDENYKSIKGLSNVGIDINLIKNTVKLGYPMLVGWNANGQWSLVIGYDDKLTENVNDDEIIIVNAEKNANTSNYQKIKASDFINKWSFSGFFKAEPAAQEKDKNCFIILDKI